MISKGLPGFRDFPPEELALRTHIFRVWRGVASRYGFEEYDGPPLEPLDLYTGKSGDEIVGQLYNFRDKGDRDVALRPEMTPTLARMVGAHGSARKKPLRWFSIPQLFRYERQQRGRLREHFQLNCDLIGEGGPLADAEIIAVAIDIMRGFGLGPADVRVRVSDRSFMSQLIGELGIPAGEVAGVFSAIDRVGKDPERARAMLVGQLQAERADKVMRLASQEYRDELRSRIAAEAPLRQTMIALEEMGLGS
jgi:histidyl-tRNA synthetase